MCCCALLGVQTLPPLKPMSASPASKEKSSIWSILNPVIGFGIAAIVFFWVLAFVVKGLGSLVPEPVKEVTNQPAAAAPAAAPAAAAAPATAAAPAASLPTLEVTIKPDSANPLAYDTKAITAKAGQKIKLTFTNTHPTLPQPHNFVIGKNGVDKGKMMSVAMAGMTLVDKGYIPESPDILAHTKLLQPGQSETIEFVVPAAGDYNYICTFPGHGAIMNGTLTAE